MKYKLFRAFFILFIFLNSLVLLVNVVCATNYYVSSLNGNDDNSGKSESSPFKTLQKINNISFNAGDCILLKCGEVWEDQLILKCVGDIDNPIILGAYGEGENPVIKCSTSFKNWTLVFDNGSKKIWRGRIENCKWPMGAWKNGKRIEHYIEDKFTLMKNKNFYAPYNRGSFYYRNDAGNPGEIEIGTRNFAIMLDGCKNVIVENIDLFGPGGDSGYGSRSVWQLCLKKCENVTVRNCVFSYGTEVGAVIGEGSVNCAFENIKSFGHESTGLYVSETGAQSLDFGNVVRNCEVYDCGALSTDHGDKGLIGVWQSAYTLIKNCYVHDNGNSTAEKFDAAISFVQSPYGRVTRCKVKNVASTGIQFAEGSDGCQADYNVIDGWGVYGSINMNEGIRVGGGVATSSANNIKIYNNLFIHGGKTSGEWAALRILYRENDGLKVANNIFYNNLGIYDIFAESKDNFKNWSFKNNLFYRFSGNAINWSGKIYDYQHILGSENGSYTKDTGQGINSLFVDPRLEDDKMGITTASPCIDKGMNVGLTEDYFGNPVPSGAGVDIGPFEYQVEHRLAPPALRISE